MAAADEQMKQCWFLKTHAETKEAQVLLKKVHLFQGIFPSRITQHLSENQYTHLQECKFGGGNNNHHLQIGNFAHKISKI